MYRRGIVVAVDPERARARVRFPDRDNVESYWLDIVQPNALANRDYRLPDVDELVAVMMDGRDEAGCILGALYTANNLPDAPSPDVRRVAFGDGAVVEYDRAAHLLRVEVPDGAVQVQAESVHLDAAVTIAGGAEPVALSGKVDAALQTLKDAISSAVTAPQDGGASLKASIVSALSAWPPSVESESLESD